MDDLRNKDFFKIMWLPGEDSVVWNMKNESQLGIDSEVYNIVQGFIDLRRWSKDYENLYNQWLNEDNKAIYDLYHEVNIRILSAIKHINSRMHALNSLLFYWYDKENNYGEQYFSWVRGPISNDILIELGEDYHFLNRLISMQDYLVFPKYESRSLKS